MMGNLTLDAELDPRDIIALSDSNAIAAFFAKLGYNTEPRTLQTPANLRITADSMARSIKKAELIADQDGLFQVYLFELASVTVALTRGIARAFRNFTGNYLLVLTSDYERLDFVLLERDLPSSGNGDSGIGQKQVSVRPRILTVERRKPSRVDIRVLRRGETFAMTAALMRLLGIHPMMCWLQRSSKRTSAAK